MKRVLFCISLALLSLSPIASAKIKVAASLPDLASIAAYVGGDRVDVFSVARNTTDPHSVEVLPTYMVRVSRADLYLKVGLSLDQWADQIIDGSRNSRIKVVDCSRGVLVLEKPSGKVDASMGDVHPDGNPHYWLDPDNGVIVAQTISEALIALDPAGRDVFNANLQRFTTETAQHLQEWKLQTGSIAERNIITYHSSWVYFAHAFGLEIVSKIEPVPGIPPTGSHLAELVKVIHDQNVRIVLQEPYFADDAAKYLSRETAVRVIKLPPSCIDASSGSYFEHFQQIVNALKGVS